MTTSVYVTQCKTWKVAQRLSGNSHNVTRHRLLVTGVSVPILEHYFQPPFCLRLLPSFRNEETKAFRKQVADEMRRIRNGT